MAKKLILILIVLSQFTGFVKKASATDALPYINPSNQYFEGITYDIGRLYGLRIDSSQKSELLGIQNNLYSNKNTFCVILMYHNFYAKGKRKGGYYIRLDDFENNLKTLKEYGFKSISIEDLYDFMKFNKKIPTRSVILTFDDGFKSFLDAYPIIKKYGYGGVVSLITGYVGSVWELNYNEIEELSKKGIEFASHTSKSHNKFAKYIDDKKFSIIARDIGDSRNYFDKVLHIKTIAFTYPRGVGSSSKELRQILLKNGFYVGFDIWKRKVNRFGDDPLSSVRIDISENSSYNDQNKFKTLIESLLGT
jgi:peptidoglycan/xylan/chitin deacetylase (PgdA/CDA1 family)